MTPVWQLCAFEARTQVRLTEAASRQGFTTREAEAFLTTCRLAPDTVTREAILGAPRGAQPRPPGGGASPLGATATETEADIEARFAAMEKAVEDK